jgi:hypothetical protein
MARVRSTARVAREGEEARCWSLVLKSFGIKNKATQMLMVKDLRPS